MIFDYCLSVIHILRSAYAIHTITQIAPDHTDDAHTRTERVKNESERMRTRKTEREEERGGHAKYHNYASQTQTHNSVHFKQRTAVFTGCVSVFLFLIWSLILTQLLIAANNISTLRSRHFFLLFLISSM